MWQEVVVAQYKILSRHLSGGTEEHHKNLSGSTRSPGQDLN
jgi:hypothetical protein